MEQENEIKFMELLFMLKEKIAVIFIVTLATGIIGWGVSSFLISPEYEASINMIVNTRIDISGNVTNDNISSAQNLVDTYAIIIKSNIVLNQVIDSLELKMSYKELYDRVFVSAVNNTQVMKIAVQDKNPATAEKIVRTISEIAPDIVSNAVEAGSCKVISQVDVNDKPVFPDVTKITVMTGLLSMMACIGIIVLKELLNDYVVDDSDVEKKLEIPALGIIPYVEEK